MVAQSRLGFDLRQGGEELFLRLPGILTRERLLPVSHQGGDFNPQRGKSLLLAMMANAEEDQARDQQNEARSQQGRQGRAAPAPHPGALPDRRAARANRL